MSGQPGDDAACDRPGQWDRPTPSEPAPSDWSGNPDDRRGSDSAGPPEAEEASSEAGRIADFEAFDRFARSGEADDPTLSGRTWRDSWRRKSGALLPGAWAKPVGAVHGVGEGGVPGDATGAGGGLAGVATSGAAAGPREAVDEGLRTATLTSAGAASGDGVTGQASAADEAQHISRKGIKLPAWLTPGRWRSSQAGASPAVPSPAVPSPAVPSPAVPNAGVAKTRASGWRRGRPGGLGGNRLALAAGGLALACTILGGVIGGYIAMHTADTTTNPTYSLGTVPPALTNRPASSVAGIAARVTPSVVMIKVNGGVGTGSGFIISGDYIVTDNHVVTLDGELNNASLRVYFSNGQSAPGQLVGRDPYSDIAVIKAVGVTRLPALTLGNSTGVDVGDPVIAVGSPLGLADTVTSGIVSAVNRPVQPGDDGSSPQVYFDAIQTDAPINPGNSGGPLVNARGQVIGVDAAIDTLGDNPLTGTQGGSIGLGFAIPINQARRVALELIRTGYATHAVIGAEINGAWGGNGAEIMPAKPGSTAAVTPGGPAASAGLEPGDVIIRFDGQTIISADTLMDAIRSLAPGTRTSVTFTQAGQTHTATIQMGSAPS
jgi:putative serine protease PepD